MSQLKDCRLDRDARAGQHIIATIYISQFCAAALFAHIRDWIDR